MKEESELKKEFQKIMKQHYFLKSDSELPYDNILSCMEDAYNLNRPTPVVQAKTAEEILDEYLLDMPLFGYVKTGDAVKAMEAYHAQFAPSAKSVEVEEAKTGRTHLECPNCGCDIEQAETISRMTEVFKWLLGHYDFPEPPAEGRPKYYWRSHLQEKLKEIGVGIKGVESPFQPRETDSRVQEKDYTLLTESLKTIYSLAKPGSAIYDICDKTLNPKK